MHAEVGDRLVIDGDPARVGLIIDVPRADGSPPYVVKWLTTGHIALVSPDQFGRVVHGSRRPTSPLAHHEVCPDSSDATWSGTNVCDSSGART